MTDEAIVKVHNLTMAYGDLLIARDLNFEITPGEIFIILGGSGCGKSTLMRHMIGLEAPKTGDIVIDGLSIVDNDDLTKEAILQKIGVMYQSGALFGSMTLLENVRLPLEEFTSLSVKAMNVIATAKLALVGLQDFIHFMPSQISGGMQKRAAIARAMVLEPKVIFLDEPSAGLDPLTSSELDHLILQLRDSLGMTFVIVSHELASIYTIANRIIMLDKETKTIIADGEPNYLREHSDNEWVRNFLLRKVIHD